MYSALTVYVVNSLRRLLTNVSEGVLTSLIGRLSKDATPSWMLVARADVSDAEFLTVLGTKGNVCIHYSMSSDVLWVDM